MSAEAVKRAQRNGGGPETRGTGASDPPPHPGQARSYHGQPILKEPVWTWEIPCYFFTGGLAGASAGLAYLAGLRGNDKLAHRAWTAAGAGIAVSPAFLVSDLGRPMRFLNMLRMFKVTSPMSVGSWILTVSGATTTLAVANSWLGLFPRSARIAKPVAAVFGLPLSTYTGALVANTAIPVWHEARLLLPVVFGSGAALSAGAAATVITPPRYAAPARRLALAAAASETITKNLMEKRLGDLGEPYEHGMPHRFSQITHASLLAGAALLATAGKRSRVAAAAAGTLLLAGALSARWSIFKAGFASAADPKYVVQSQRERMRTEKRPGAARRTPAGA